MKKSGKFRRVVSIVLTLLLALSLFSVSAVPASADVSMQASTPAFTVNTYYATTVGFGGKEWRVIGHDGTGVVSASNTLTLLAKTSFGTVAFSDGNNEYSGSTLQTAMDSAYGGISNTKEKDLVIPRDLAGGAANNAKDGMSGANVTGAGFWPLSVSEANSVNSELRGLQSDWWLRSPGYYSVNAAIVENNGIIYTNGYSVDSSESVHPAFNLDLSSVLFTSDASGASAKSAAAVGGGLQKAAALSASTAVKFTASTSDTSFLSLTCTDTAARNVNAGDTVSMNYSGAKTGGNKVVSCVLVNSSDEVVYYGKLASAASGTASFTVPDTADLPNGSYTIKIFNEEANGDNYTDFASTPIAIPMNVPQYHTGDIAVINSIIANNGLSWTPAPADGSSVPEDWYVANWSSDTGSKRIIGLNISSCGIARFAERVGADRFGGFLLRV